MLPGNPMNQYGVPMRYLLSEFVVRIEEANFSKEYFYHCMH